MSWSISLLGTPDKVKEKLMAESARLTGLSKQEFDEALPHLTGLVDQIVCDQQPPLVEFNGNGHASFKEGRKIDGNLSVSIKRLHTTLCV